MDTPSDLDKRAMQLFCQGRFADAEPLFRRSLIIREQQLGPAHLDVAANLSNLGVCLYQLGKYAEAEHLYRRCLAISEQQLGTDHLEVAKRVGNLGALLLEGGNYVGAESLLRRCYSIMEKCLGPEHPDVAKSLQNLAGLLYVLGNYSEAEPHYRHCLMILEKQLGPDHPEVADALGNLAGNLHMLGSYAEAEILYRRSLAIREKWLGSAHPDVALSLNNLATLSVALGNYAEAESCYYRSLAILEKQLGEDHPAVAEGLSNLAALLSSHGKFAEAEPLFCRSLRILEQQFGPEHLSVAQNLSKQANCLYRIGNYAEAEQLYRYSLSIQKKRLGPDNPSVAVTLNNLAIVSRTLGNYTEAESLHQRSLAILEQNFGPDHPDTGMSLMNFAASFDGAGRTQSAILCAKRAINIFQNVRQNVSSIGEEQLNTYDMSIESYYNFLASILIKARRYGEAEQVMGMLKDKELFELLRRDAQLNISIKAVPFNYIEALLINKFDKISAELYSTSKQIAALRQQTTRSYERDRELAGLEETIYSRKERLSEFFANIDSELPESYSDDDDTCKTIDITGLSINTVVVFTVTAENDFHAVMITPHSRKPFSSEYKSFELSKKILLFRDLLKKPESDAYLTLAQELYDIIIRPMEQELNSKGIDTVIWKLNGLLRLLPLPALHDGKQFFLEKFCNTCITTTSNLEEVQHEPWNGLGMGTTREHDGLQPLLAVKDELEGIIRSEGTAGVLPGKILLDEEFTRNSMLANLADGYKAVHFASHFELSPVNETMSYLLLGDGSKIRMDELRESPRLFNGVDLVVFSACSTGLGSTSVKGREVDGIGYLGELQGASAVLATLWPVEDISTSMLMREFYRVREGGITKTEALRRAQLALLKGIIQSEDGHDFTHPFFWAPFILIGNGS